MSKSATAGVFVLALVGLVAGCGGGGDGDGDIAATQSSPIIYVVDEQHKLGTVNLSTGDVVVIGDTGVVMTDIAFDTLGNLYGISVNQLYRIDKTTAAAEPVGTPTLTDATSLEFSRKNVLYTADQFLRRVNLTTGATTRIGNAGFENYPSSGDIAFTATGMYLTSKNPSSDSTNNHLVRLNPSTGTASNVGPIGYPNVYGLVSNDNLHLYGFSGSEVISIDTATGQGSLLLNIGGKGLGNINGAAYHY